ncbi:hypothetical protein K435DRAFT_877565 [Dendrothele bispora CBS 962.96]|uniref:Uncharacterized protein n=1 Tax=Dendrothele bispora (strain CBS 962.96) TaxID=1314807 RepID=A0A4S8KPW8_DENBC|nr:hypothetical protein K435DRAFT_877565 [Dendrothele bispora CBS 962.96]
MVNSVDIPENIWNLDFNMLSQKTTGMRSDWFESIPGHLIQKTEFDLTPEQNSSESPRVYTLDTALSSDDRGNVPSSLVYVDKLRSLNQRSLAMHLYRSFQAVLACQEALWEELKDRLRN